MEVKYLVDKLEYDAKILVHSTCKKKFLWKMKDNIRGFPMKAFACLKSKLFSLTYEVEILVKEETV